MFIYLISLIDDLDPSSSQEPISSSTSDPVIITTENVELNGAGKFDFKPDEGAFHLDVPVGASGISFVARLWFDPAGQPVDCDVRETALIDAARIGCAQLMRSARFKMLSGIDMSYRRGFLDVQFSFFRDSLARPAGHTTYASPRPGYANVVVNYPPKNASASTMLDATDARFVVAIQPDDYPPVAIRYRLESASTVLMGVDRNGFVRSCRPFGTSEVRTSFLDNYTCTLMLNRARFEFLESAERYVGLRYIKKTMRWKLPS